jgi:ribosomal protein S18 acetylase RimI-like enzyme
VESARSATVGDLDVVMACLAGLRDELEPMRGGLVWARHDRRTDLDDADAVAALLAAAASEVVVGMIDDTIVGVGLAEAVALRDGGTLGVIHELYVLPEAREVGVGEAIVNELIARLDARGCIGIDAFALPGHRATKNFFEEQGFVARQLTMHRPLRDDTEPPTSAA